MIHYFLVWMNEMRQKVSMLNGTYVWAMGYVHDRCAVNDDAVNDPCHSRRRRRRHPLLYRLCDAHSIQAIVVVLSLNSPHERSVNRCAYLLMIRRPELHFSMTRSRQNNSRAIVPSVKWCPKKGSEISISFQTKGIPIEFACSLNCNVVRFLYETF